MNCPKLTFFTDYLSQKLDPSKINDLEAHLASCSSCRQRHLKLLSITQCLALQPGEFEDPLLSERIMHRVVREPSREQNNRLPKKNWFRFSLLPVPVAAALGLMLLLWPLIFEHKQHPGMHPGQQILSRGNPKDALNHWVSFKIFRGGKHSYQRVEGNITARDYLAFAYENKSPQGLDHLMIFGVHDKGDLFWYYPAHLEPGQNPCSIPVKKTKQLTRLPDEVRHRIPPGKMRIWALFSAKPLCVQEIEQQLQQQFAKEGRISSLPFLDKTNIAQQMYMVDVDAK